MLVTRVRMPAQARQASWERLRCRAVSLPVPARLLGGVHAGQVRAPIISISKDDGEADLLGPVLRPQDTAVVNRSAPWADKKDVAFFRHAPCCWLPLALNAHALHPRACLLPSGSTLTALHCAPARARRGVPSCGAMPFPMHCARSWVARLATRPEYQGILDAGVARPPGLSCSMPRHCCCTHHTPSLPAAPSYAGARSPHTLLCAQSLPAILLAQA